MSREHDSDNRRVIEAFHAQGGVVDPGLDLLLLRHVGARSGRERDPTMQEGRAGIRLLVDNPLAHWRLDDTTVAVLASNRGGQDHESSS